MGIKFVIDDTPRFVATGSVGRRRDTTTYNGPVSPSELAGVFEDVPDRVDLTILTVPLEPPLPADVEGLELGLDHGSHRHLREALATTIGVELDWMWGHRPLAADIARMRGLPEGDFAYPGDDPAWESEQFDWWDERARRWEDVDDDLVVLLNHSDVDGTYSPEQCRVIAPALSRAITHLEGNGHTEPDTLVHARGLLQLIEACATYQRQLQLA